ncbi:MAG: hypothetical protein K6U02_00765 [Firmicutes bacterium]|nr:hypothetical protein [Bacillota bacterium]
MRPTRRLFAVLALFAGLALTAPAAALAQDERWLHVRVDASDGQGEKVRINLPLSLAEKVLPAIHTHELRGGRLRIHHRGLHEVDIRAIVEALKTTRDGEFLTVESEKENVRVAKQGGYLRVEVRGKNGTTVDATVPMAVVEALLDTEDPNELNVAAALRALAAHGDIVIVDVREQKESVRVWVDTRSTQD